MMRRTIAAGCAGLIALSLAACGGGGTGAGTATTARETAAAVSDTATGDAVALTDATIRAKAAADAPEGKDMTALFGTLHNNSGEDVTVTGFTTSLGAAKYEIHEVVDGVMQQKPGGITIPAGASHELKPGGDHMMILDYMPEIPAGDTVDVTLELADGTSVTVPGVAVRTMLPGDEDYGEDGELQGHQHGMEHKH